MYRRNSFDKVIFEVFYIRLVTREIPKARFFGRQDRHGLDTRP